MKLIPIEALVLVVLVSLIIGFIVGFLIGIEFNKVPIIIIDTSNEEMLDKACLYHGIEKADYIIYSGHSFERDGKRCSLFNNGFRSKCASEYGKN